VGANFQARVKKVPSSVPHQSTGLRSGPGRGRSHMGYGAAVYGWGRGSEVNLHGFIGFLDLRENVFFLIQRLGVVLPPAGRVFF